MRALIPIIPLFASILAFGAHLQAVPAYEFQLNLRADTVLPIDRRLIVLSVAERILQRENIDFAAISHNLPNPFLYQSRIAQVEEASTEPELEPEPTLSQREVLERIASTLAGRITGTLERGGNIFVQLSSGELLRVGNRIPVRMPTLSDEAFIIEIVAIDADGMVLGLGNSRIGLPMPTTARGGARLTPSAADETPAQP